MVNISSLGRLGSTISAVSSLGGARGGFNFDRERVAAHGDPQKGYKWIVQFPSMFSALGDPLNTEKFLFTIPGVTSEPSYKAGSNNYNPSISDVEAFSATFFLDEDASTLEDIMNWKALIQNEDGTYNMPLDYKMDVIAMLLNGRGKEVALFRYGGVFPTTTSPLQGDYASSERMVLEQQFSVDTCTVRINGANIVGAANLRNLNNIIKGVTSVAKTASNISSFLGI